MDEVFVVEEKYDGIRAVLHKRGNAVRLYSESAEDISSAFPILIAQGKVLSDGDLIVDGHVVPHDDTVTFYCFDILYTDKPLTTQPWHERKKELRVLNFTENIKEACSIIIKNTEELEKAVKLASSLPKSLGAIVKGYESTYTPNSNTKEWFEYNAGNPTKTG